MSSELIVMTFPHRGDAKTVLKAMMTMRKSSILGLESSVLVTKSRQGCFTYHPKESDIVQGNSDTQILLSIAQLTFDPPQEGVVGPLKEKGLDDRFIKNLATVMEGQASALFILLEKGRGFDNREILNTLALFKGTIHQTSLLSDVEDYLTNESMLQVKDRKY